MAASQTYLVWHSGSVLCYRDKGVIKRVQWTLKRQQAVIALMNSFPPAGGPEDE